MTLKEKILTRIKGKYGLRVTALGLLTMGYVLLGEHIYMWGINDTFGHEHVGMILITIAIYIGYLSTKVNPTK